MKLEITGKFRIAKVVVKVKVQDSVVLRRCVMTLDAELDAITAKAIGPDAVTARDGILEGGMSKVILPIDALETDCSLEGDVRRCHIPRIRGVKATIQRGPDDPGDDDSDEDEDAEPKAKANAEPTNERTAVIKLEFEFPFSDDAWLFLGKTAGAWAEVKLEPLQQTLPGLGKTARVSGSKDDKDRLPF